MTTKANAAWMPIDMQIPGDDIEVNESKNEFDEFKIFFRDLDGVEAAGGGAHSVVVEKNGWNLEAQFTQTIAPQDNLFADFTLFHEEDDIDGHKHDSGPNFEIEFDIIFDPMTGTYKEVFEINEMVTKSLRLPHENHFDFVKIDGNSVIQGNQIISWNFNIDARHSIPEPTSTLSLLSLGILGAGATLKRKVKGSNSIEKVG